MQDVVLTVVGILVALVAYGVFLNILSEQRTQPAYPATASYASAAAQTTACEALNNNQGYYEFKSDSPNTAKLDADNCPATARFAGVLSLTGLMPLVMVGGLIGYAASWLIRKRQEYM